MKNVLAVSNYFLFEEGIVSTFKESQNFKIYVSSFDLICESVESFAIDLILLDVSSRKHYDLNELIKLKQDYPSVKMLFIVANNLEISLLNKFPFEIDGMVNYHITRENLFIACNVVLQGKKYFSNEVLSLLTPSLKKSKMIHTDFSLLTSREAQIVILFSKGLLAKDIAMRLDLSYHTINTHRKNILKKLFLNSTTELIVYGINLGLHDH